MINPKLELLERSDDDGRVLFKLLESYSYNLGPGCTVVVPEGYVTNFGTIPKMMWWWVSPSQLGQAAIVHDYMCGESFDNKQIDSGFSRWVADAALYEIMERMGFGWPKRFLVWLAVRAAAKWQGKYKMKQ